LLSNHFLFIFVLKVAWHCCWQWNVMKSKFIIKNSDFFGFGLKWKNRIDYPYPKSYFENGLSITTQSTKLDCNLDWTIHQLPELKCCYSGFSTLINLIIHYDLFFQSTNTTSCSKWIVWFSGLFNSRFLTSRIRSNVFAPKMIFQVSIFKLNLKKSGIKQDFKGPLDSQITRWYDVRVSFV